MQKTARSKHKKPFLMFLIITIVMLPTLLVFVKKLALFNNSATFFTPSNITYEIKNSKNTNMHHTMINFITKKTSRGNCLSFDPHNFYTQLQSMFPQIDNFEWKILPSKTLHMTIDIAQPELIINKKYTIGQTNKLLTLNLFNQSELENLPHLTIDDSLINKKFDTVVFDFFQSIPNEVFEIFDITYYSARKIILQKKEGLYNYHIITDMQSFFNQDKVNYIQTIFKDLMEKKVITNWRLKKQRSPFVFDMRIENQIIVKLPEPFKRGRGL